MSVLYFIQHGVRTPLDLPWSCKLLVKNAACLSLPGPQNRLPLNETKWSLNFVIQRAWLFILQWLSHICPPHDGKNPMVLPHLSVRRSCAPALLFSIAQNVWRNARWGEFQHSTHC